MEVHEADAIEDRLTALLEARLEVRLGEELSELRRQFQALQSTVDSEMLEAFRRLKRQTGELSQKVEVLMAAAGGSQVPEVEAKLVKLAKRVAAMDKGQAPPAMSGDGGERACCCAAPLLEAKLSDLAMRVKNLGVAEHLQALDDRMAEMGRELLNFMEDRASSLEKDVAKLRVQGPNAGQVSQVEFQGLRAQLDAVGKSVKEVHHEQTYLRGLTHGIEDSLRLLEERADCAPATKVTKASHPQRAGAVQPESEADEQGYPAELSELSDLSVAEAEAAAEAADAAEVAKLRAAQVQAAEEELRADSHSDLAGSRLQLPSSGRWSRSSCCAAAMPLESDPPTAEPVWALPAALAPQQTLLRSIHEMAGQPLLREPKALRSESPEPQAAAPVEVACQQSPERPRGRLKSRLPKPQDLSVSFEGEEDVQESPVRPRPSSGSRASSPATPGRAVPERLLRSTASTTAKTVSGHADRAPSKSASPLKGRPPTVPKLKV